MKNGSFQYSDESTFVRISQDADEEGEIYSTAACWQARSFKFAVVVSVIALVLISLLVVCLATGLAGKNGTVKGTQSLLPHTTPLTVH